MRLRFLKTLITYGILILYVLIPMLDSMVCTDCIGKAPFQGETSICQLQTPHGVVNYASGDGGQSKTVPDGQGGASFCSICANGRMGVDLFSPPVHIAVAQWDGPSTVPVLSYLRHSIDKPPQNRLV